MRLSPLSLLLLAGLTMTSAAAFASGCGEDMDWEEPEAPTFAAHVRAGLHSPRPASYMAAQEGQERAPLGVVADYLPPAGDARRPIMEVDEDGAPVVYSSDEDEEEEEGYGVFSFHMDALADRLQSVVEQFMSSSILGDVGLQTPLVFDLRSLPSIQLLSAEPPRLQLPEYPLACLQFIRIEERRVPEPSPYQDRQISWKLPADLRLDASLLREWFVTPHPRLALKAPTKTPSVTAEEVD